MRTAGRDRGAPPGHRAGVAGMLLGADPDQRLSAQRLSPGALRLPRDHRQIELAAAHAGDQLDAQVADHLQLHRREAGLEGGQRVRQVDHVIVRNAESQASAEALVVDVLPGEGVAPEHLAGAAAAPVCRVSPWQYWSGGVGALLAALGLTELRPELLLGLAAVTAGAWLSGGGEPPGGVRGAHP